MTVAVTTMYRMAELRLQVCSELFTCVSFTLYFQGIEFAQSRPNGLSTISGVFAPVALSMFSILLFMRMGFVVGQLGFLMTVVQLLMAYGIVMLTVLSLCAISSNGAVESGGVYYSFLMSYFIVTVSDMISRSLGPEFGGAIGVLFFVANVFSCALYISGFTEALLNNLGGGQFPDSPMWRFLYCVLVSIVLLIIGLLGAGIFAKTALFTFILISTSNFPFKICYSTWLFSVIFDGAMQVPIPKVNTPAYRVHANASDPDSPMIVQLNQTLTANYTGFSFRTLGENMFTNYTMDYTTERQTDFALMFAIIFSGVTGHDGHKLPKMVYPHWDFFYYVVFLYEQSYRYALFRSVLVSID
ncbi:hypothetical protein TELCIR_13207 [Teladorsagia circumcincta]|uniref:Solute carrier family 12 member 9 n=1 Tax=Teladorsagia circumcincta TaxID=45464 RepID=A0A2G9U4D4_TELCI|nr:hypothetical protein TELCIR_13207 [Teladorsagia circumcincta]